MTGDPRYDIARLVDEATPIGETRDTTLPEEKKRATGWPVLLPATLHGLPVPERQFCVPDWIPDRTVTLLSGDGGTGKSLLAMQLATCCAMGLPFLGMEIARRKVLYLAAEDDQAEMHRRQVDINRGLGIEMGDLDDQLAWRILDGESAVLGDVKVGQRHLTGTNTYNNLRNYCRENGIQLVVIDTVADTFGGLEIDRQHVTRYVRLAEAIARDNDGAVVLVAHPSVAGLKDRTGISGSSAWRNAVRSVIYMTRPDPDASGMPIDRDERVLERLKANFAPAGGRIELRYDQGHFVLGGDGLGFVTHSVDAVVVDSKILTAIRLAIESGKFLSPKKQSEFYYVKSLKSFDSIRNYTLNQIKASGDRMIAEGHLRIAHIGLGRNLKYVIAPSDYPPFPDERDPKTGEKRGA